MSIPEYAEKIETLDEIAARVLRSRYHGAVVAPVAEGAAYQGASFDRDQIRRALTGAFLTANGDGTFGPTDDSWEEDIRRVQAVLDAIGGPL